MEVSRYVKKAEAEEKGRSRSRSMHCQEAVRWNMHTGMQLAQACDAHTCVYMYMQLCQAVRTWLHCSLYSNSPDWTQELDDNNHHAYKKKNVKKRIKKRHTTGLVTKTLLFIVFLKKQQQLLHFWNLGYTVHKNQWL